MDNDNQQNKPRELTDDERKALREGLALEEMVKGSPGWQIVKKILEDRAFHTWADPRECKDEKEWTFRELNSFWSATNANELLAEINRRIANAQYLDKVSKGEVKTTSMRI